MSDQLRSIDHNGHVPDDHLENEPTTADLLFQLGRIQGIIDVLTGTISEAVA